MNEGRVNAMLAEVERLLADLQEACGTCGLCAGDGDECSACRGSGLELVQPAAVRAAVARLRAAAGNAARVPASRGTWQVINSEWERMLADGWWPEPGRVAVLLPSEKDPQELQELPREYGAPRDLIASARRAAEAPSTPFRLRGYGRECLVVAHRLAPFRERAAARECAGWLRAAGQALIGLAHQREAVIAGSYLAGWAAETAGAADAASRDLVLYLLGRAEGAAEALASGADLLEPEVTP